MRNLNNLFEILKTLHNFEEYGPTHKWIISIKHTQNNRMNIGRDRNMQN